MCDFTVLISSVLMDILENKNTFSEDTRAFDSGILSHGLEKLWVCVGPVIWVYFML